MCAFYIYAFEYFIDENFGVCKIFFAYVVTCAVLLVELAYEAVLPLVEENEEVDVNENAPLTIAETDANIPVCTVSEAVMFMDLSNECALMFRNSANNHISMVYRRKDGNIGWVEPKSDN